MDTPSEVPVAMPDGSTAVVPGEAPAATGEAAAGTPGEAPAKKRMSRGKKWAIGIGALVLLLVLSCCWWEFVDLELVPEAVGGGSAVALIHIEGVIEGGTSASTSPEYVLDQISRALNDSRVSAIVLRIDSPGGTVAASQEIALAVRRANLRKPVVVSVGDMCASGAYMVASQAKEIIASPGSAVGSIGVIQELVNVEGLLDKVGVKFTTLHEGQYKDVGSPYRGVTATETAMMQAELAKVYDRFILDVAKGRKMPEPKVRELATGWVWLGTEAHDLGLIDSLGNYDDAIDRAGTLGKITGTPEIITYDEADPITTLLENLMGLKAKGQVLDADTLRRISLPR